MQHPYWRAFLRQPSGVVAAVAIGALALLAIAGPIVWGADGTRLDPAAASEGASWAHLLGTDDLGRDVLARTLAATRLSLLLAVLATGVSAILGIGAGVLLATIGRPGIRSVAARILDALLAFPPIIVALFLAAILNVGGTGAAVAVGIAAAPRFARFAYTLSLSVRSQDFVAAARLLRLSRRTVMLRHVLPNMAEPLLITVFLAIGFAIVTVSALSFLGLGVQPLQYDWGTLLTQGVKDIYTNPAAALGPAVAIAVAGTAFGYLGEALAAAADPRAWSAPVTGRKAAPPEALPAAPVLDAPIDVDADTVLRVENLRVTIPSKDGDLHPVDGISFAARRGEVLGIVGESGSGKSMTVLAIAGLCPHPAQVGADRLEVCGKPVGQHGRDDLQRGRDVAVVFQDPMSSLNPALRIETQLTEAPRQHLGLSRGEARELALNALRDVRLAAPELRLRQYPHELSGGMRQRVAIAMGLSMEPALLLADEPTTALDVTLQAQIIALLRGLTERGMAVVLVSHDIGVVAEICDRVLVMYAGRIVEEGSVAEVLEEPLHPYTIGLVESLPDIDREAGQDLAAIPGAPFQLGDDVFGCPFAPRCTVATDRCATERPGLVEARPGRHAACWATAPEPEAHAVGERS